jgi:hypothetical protein
MGSLGRLATCSEDVEGGERELLSVTLHGTIEVVEILDETRIMLGRFENIEVLDTDECRW